MVCWYVKIISRKNLTDLIDSFLDPHFSPFPLISVNFLAFTKINLRRVDSPTNERAVISMRQSVGKLMVRTSEWKKPWKLTISRFQWNHFTHGILFMSIFRGLWIEKNRTKCFSVGPSYVGLESRPLTKGP